MLSDHEKKETCGICGADFIWNYAFGKRPHRIRSHSAAESWQTVICCDVCYLKDCLNEKKKLPLEDYMKQRSEIRNQIKSITAQVKSLEADIKQHIDKHPVIMVPWWRTMHGGIFDIGKKVALPDKVLEGKKMRMQLSLNNREDLKQEESKLDSKINYAKVDWIDKALIKAIADQKAAQQRLRLGAQEYERFCAEAKHNLEREFERTQFFIQPRDYRRGNAIDNYFRNRISDLVIAAFGNRCVLCGDQDYLTFDHYGLSKNEGGNFILISSDKSSFRVNVAVLCRSCNAMKGQSAHSFYFNDEQQEQVKAGQRKLLDALLHDKKFLFLFKKWYS